MAIIGEDGIKYSYDSEELIRELKSDIEEFGNFRARAYYKRENGAKLYTDYQFEEDDVEGAYDLVDAAFLLKYLNKQNDPM
ncbi:hypothetical protein FEZ48_02075 [Marinilactibacillus psychrotolerans]|uniref:Uncharacterized protein n=1 Tax=Marinilactibacillus psychrotolerans TaxID=191770 RepID=A0A5R9C7L1_9LACT|nr:hypothetical protein [Marinilactibacillus psychrotolerans]TLQ09250.1 hypothetical protein FEZ48_02075 [Marinilactibacillus psychrotolerans]